MEEVVDPAVPVDDRADWTPEKRSCFEWRDGYAVLVGVSWGKLPFDLQQKWELYNCNDYMDCHTAACSYHSGTAEHHMHDHPVYQRPQSAADWEIANGFIPKKAAEKLMRNRAIENSLKSEEEAEDAGNNEELKTKEESEFKHPEVKKIMEHHHQVQHQHQHQSAHHIEGVRHSKLDEFKLKYDKSKGSI